MFPEKSTNFDGLLWGLMQKKTFGNFRKLKANDVITKTSSPHICCRDFHTEPLISPILDHFWWKYGYTPLYRCRTIVPINIIAQNMIFIQWEWHKCSISVRKNNDMIDFLRTTVRGCHSNGCNNVCQRQNFFVGNLRKS